MLFFVQLVWIIYTWTAPFSVGTSINTIILFAYQKNLSEQQNHHNRSVLILLVIGSTFLNSDFSRGYTVGW